MNKKSFRSGVLKRAEGYLVNAESRVSLAGMQRDLELSNSDMAQVRRWLNVLVENGSVIELPASTNDKTKTRHFIYAKEGESQSALHDGIVSVIEDIFSRNKTDVSKKIVKKIRNVFG